MSVAVLAFGAASALGVGEAAFDVGAAGQTPRDVWSQRLGGKPFARVTALHAPRAERPRAMLELGLEQVVAQLSQRVPAFREQRIGVVIGTSSGGFAALERALANEAETWAQSAYFSPLRAVEAALGRAPERLVSLGAACASSTLSLGLGLRWLELGVVDLVIAGGYDAESDWVGAGFDALKATSASVPRPFRAERDGMALGEGVALLALGRATERAFGFVHGFGASTDAVHITAPDRTGQGLARAITQALADAQVTPRHVDFVSVHGTATSFNDAAEAAALLRVLGDAELALHAFKAVVGHTLGAAGALESLAAFSAFQRGVVPASGSFGSTMPELRAVLPKANVPAETTHCLKLSTAFGGANAALVLGKVPAAMRVRKRRSVRLLALGARRTSLDPSSVAPLLTAPLERLPRSDTLSELAVAAAADVLHVAVDRRRTGVVVGSVTSCLEADAAFGERVMARGREHAEPRRFPATSPNACAGHVAIAFGLGALSHAVGAGERAGLEAVAVAADWIAAGDADAIVVISAEHGGAVADRVLRANGVALRKPGAQALLLSAAGTGPELPDVSEMKDISDVFAWAAAARLPGPEAFGKVRPPE